MTKITIANAQTRKASGARGPSLCRDKCRQSEDSRAHRRVNDVGGQARDTERADQLAFHGGLNGRTHAPQAARAGALRQVVSCRSAKLLYSS